MDSYFQSVLPEPFRILGLSLKPLSLGRYRLLKRFNCSFVADGESLVSPGDLFLGVFICAQSCREFLAALESGKLKRAMDKWGEKIFGKKSHRKAKPKDANSAKTVEPRAFDYFEKVSLFKRYLSDSITIPSYWETNTDAPLSGSHWSQNVEVVLRGELGWSAEEIEESPLSKAISDYYKWLENKGIIQIIDPEEFEQIKQDADHNTAVISKILGIKDGA